MLTNVGRPNAVDHCASTDRILGARAHQLVHSGRVHSCLGGDSLGGYRNPDHPGPTLVTSRERPVAAHYDPAQNHLLASLAPDEQARIFPHLQLIDMPLGKVLYEPGETLRHVYFPLDCIASKLYVLADGSSDEIAVVGNEGLVGIALIMGGETTPSRAVVYSSGYAYRLCGSRLKDEFHSNGRLNELFLRYTQSLLTQMAQTAVCNRHHSIDQQLCRWLLLTLDRLPRDRIAITQEQIANMLGVRREGVTDAAGKLQRLGVIKCSRGAITVLDRPRLEELCCECYVVVKKESDRLIPYICPRAAVVPHS